MLHHFSCSIVLLGFCLLGCGRHQPAPTDAPPLFKWLQQRDYLKVIALAEEGLSEAARGDARYRDLWLARTEAWAHTEPGKATDAIEAELARDPPWLQPEDAVYLSVVWKQTRSFIQCYSTLQQALAVWPDEPSVRSAHDDAALDVRGWHRWHDCSPPRSSALCGCCCY